MKRDESSGRIGPISTWLSMSLHALVVALIAILVLNSTDGTLAHGVAVLSLSTLFAATYVLGVLPDGALPEPGRRGTWWIGALTLEWLALLWLSVEATYLVFALFFLYLRLLGTVRGIVAVIGTTLVAICAFGLHRGFDVAGIVGPVLGAGVAIVIGLGYEALNREVARRQRLIEELTRTRDQLAVAEHAAGVVAERERLAREIHDTVSQSLSSVIMLLHAAQRSGPGTEKGGERLEQARQAATEALAETREFIHALAPPALRNAGIGDALVRLGARTRDTTGLQVEVAVPEDTGIVPTPVETALLRIAQGAIANVIQHAHATRVDLTLTRLDDEIILDIVDAGVGFDPAHLGTLGDGSTSFGLAAMQERATSLGGRLVVESRPGHGTSVVASFAVAP
ncbi:sensor histidine kinase [Aeromicrobium choanae]|nr:sensor histidine kinase [Aeromicrobium choanae]